MKKLMILLCSFAAGVAMADEYGDLLPKAARDWTRQFLESQNRPSALADKNVYIVTNDVVFTGESGESALRVAENASVCILICEGASLACHGGDGLPASAGGDGVVPAFSNETVTVYEYGAWDFTYQMPRFALAAAGDGGAGGQGGGAGIRVSLAERLDGLVSLRVQRGQAGYDIPFHRGALGAAEGLLQIENRLLLGGEVVLDVFVDCKGDAAALGVTVVLKMIFLSHLDAFLAVDVVDCCENCIDRLACVDLMAEIRMVICYADAVSFIVRTDDESVFESFCQCVGSVVGRALDVGADGGMVVKHDE